MELLALVSHTSNGSVLEGPMNFIERSETSKPACTCCYIVVEIQGTWWIDVEGKPCGPCDTKQEAIECAFKLIDAFGDRSRPAAVYAPGDDGKTELIWQGRHP